MTRNELVDFIDAKLAESHDYNSSAEAVRDVMVAAFDLMADALGLTGFQASWAALQGYAAAMHYDCPLIVLKAEDMLYPQYDLPGRLAEWMDECGPWLTEHAQALLDERKDDGFVVDRVREHWRTIARQAPHNPLTVVGDSGSGGAS